MFFGKVLIEFKLMKVGMEGGAVVGIRNVPAGEKMNGIHFNSEFITFISCIRKVIVQVVVSPFNIINSKVGCLFALVTAS